MGIRTQTRADIKTISFSVCARSWRSASFVGTRRVLISKDFIKFLRGSHNVGAPQELVEMMGIEPMSENPLIKPSPWAVCLLEFPIKSANRHALYPGSPFLLDRLKIEPPMQVHR